MNNSGLNLLSLQDTITLSVNNLVGMMADFFPRLIVAISIMLIGLVVAGWVKSVIGGLIRAVHLSRLVKNSPVERFFSFSESEVRIDAILGELGRWAVIYLFLIASFSLLGLNGVSTFLANLLSFLPRLFSALVIFVLGVLAAGVVESSVKAAVSGIDLAAGRLAAKVMSYMVMVFVILASISELGIAQFFINVLFIGFVSMMALGIGLAVGLGAKDTVAESLKRWHKKVN
jgi:hypothetical protein